MFINQGPYLVIGMGVSGRAVTRLLKKMNCEVLTFDQKESADIKNWSDVPDSIKCLVVSPGVPLSLPPIQALLQKGIMLQSELEIGSHFLNHEKVIGVTGSLGKSTVVSLLDRAAESAGLSYFCGGNIGTPLAQYAEGLVSKPESRVDWVILELSSFQLENFSSLNCSASVITYLSPNHLERYDNLESYYKTKLKLFEKTNTKKLFANSRGGDNIIFLENTDLKLHINWIDRDSLQDLKVDPPFKLLGEHNLDNIALAAAVANSLAWPKEFHKGLKSFSGLSHRIQQLDKWNHRFIVNDSKATSIESVITAANSCLAKLDHGAKLFLLIGGRDKQLPWEALQSLVDSENIEFVLFGECREIILKKLKFKETPSSFKTLDEAISHCKDHSRPSDWICLSPGGSSLDEFKNFEYRGNHFKDKFTI